MSRPALALVTLLQPNVAVDVLVVKRAACLALAYKESVATKFWSV
jgi:hypothetical protein